jgi:hypothetical protein
MHSQRHPRIPLPTDTAEVLWEQVSSDLYVPAETAESSNMSMPGHEAPVDAQPEDLTLEHTRFAAVHNAGCTKHHAAPSPRSQVWVALELLHRCTVAKAYLHNALATFPPVGSSQDGEPAEEGLARHGEVIESILQPPLQIRGCHRLRGHRHRRVDPHVCLTKLSSLHAGPGLR